MTRGDLPQEFRDCGGNAAAYALRALAAAEATDFRRHLDDCVVCRDEIAAFGQVVDALAMAAPQHPAPRGLRRRVMRDVLAEPGLAEPQKRRRRARSLVPRRRLARPALAGALLAAAAVTVTGGLELLPSGSSGTRVIQARVNGVSGSAQLSVAGAHAELTVSHLPSPPAGRIYEVWINRDHHAPSPTRSLFSVTAAGAAEVGVPGDVRGASAIMVTQEPAGGSLVPTKPPVIVARLSSE